MVLDERRTRRARVAVVAAFVSHAAISGTLGPRIPAIKAQAGLSAPALGAALVGFTVGLFVGTRLASWPLRRFGSRAVLRVGIPLFALTLVVPSTAHALGTLSVGLFLLGLWAGFIDVAMNDAAVVVERAAGRPIMSGIHATWSAGLLCASGAAALAAGLDASPTAHFSIAAVVIAAAGVPILRALPSPDEGGTTTSASHTRTTRPDWSRVLPLGLVGFCSFLGEGSMADWSAVYLKESLGASAAAAALGFSGFSLGMMLTRFEADRLSARVGPVALVRTGGLLAALGLATALIVPAKAAAFVGFAILGAALAPVVPTVFSAAGNLPSGTTSLGWVVTISYAGAMLGPAVIGFASRVTSLRVALGIPALLALVIAALARAVGTAQGPAREGARPPAEGPW